LTGHSCSTYPGGEGELLLVVEGTKLRGRLLVEDDVFREIESAIDERSDFDGSSFSSLEDFSTMCR
jgi:hypothetical protein